MECMCLALFYFLLTILKSQLIVFSATSFFFLPCLIWLKMYGEMFGAALLQSTEEPYRTCLWGELVKRRSLTAARFVDASFLDFMQQENKPAQFAR